MSPFDTVSTVHAVVESWHTWMIDNVRQVRIKCMFETINRTRSRTSNIFWQRIEQSNGTRPETISKYDRYTNVYMRDNIIYFSMFRMSAYYRLRKRPLLFSIHKLYSIVLVSSAESLTSIERGYHCLNNPASQVLI